MKTWTVMVFMAGDNNLERAAEADLLEMLQVGSGEQLNVLVQFDGRAGAVRYYVEPGKLQTVGDPLGDTNTGDPAVLTDFIRWARTSYPARHYLLVIWNHGTGWEDVPSTFDWQTVRGAVRSDQSKAPIFASTIEKGRRLSQTRAVALDATSHDFLDNNELKKGLADALDGEALDVVGFDACLMAMIEIGYQIREHARFAVGSQETEPEQGWPYEAVLKALHDEPEMTPRRLSQMIVNSYGEMGVKWRAPTKYTQSALDLSQISMTFGLIKQLAERLKESYPNRLQVRRVVDEASSRRKGAKRFRDGNSVDLYDWAWRLRQLCDAGQETGLEGDLDALLSHLKPGANDGLIVARAAELGANYVNQNKRHIERLVAPDAAGVNDDRDQVHGVSIYLPLPTRYSELYETLDFAQTGWGDFAKRVSTNLK